MTRRGPAPRALDERHIGLEARVAEHDHLSLKLWLRLLACSTQIENDIRRRLYSAFAVSLARFDYLAQLHRHPDGLRMKLLTRHLMVTGGSVTGLTDELEGDGLVQRDDDPLDRRSVRVRLTAKGRKSFERMAREHEAWVEQLFGGLDAKRKATLYELLGSLRTQMAAASVEDAAVQPRRRAER